MCSAMESVLHLRVHTGPTKHTHTDLSYICDPPFSRCQAHWPPGHLPGPWVCCVPPSTRPHTAAESPAHTAPCCCPASPVTSALCLLGGTAPQPPREVFGVCVWSPLSAPRTLRILEIICLTLLLSPWPLAPEHSLRKDRPTQLSLVWNGESTHQQQTSRRVLR